MKKNKILQIILWIAQGLLVGVGAILPGVSGGTLCYVFGIYDPILETLTSPLKGIKKYWFMLMFVGIGGALGFVVPFRKTYSVLSEKTYRFPA